jgi:hypothetical protein
MRPKVMNGQNSQSGEVTNTNIVHPVNSHALR